VNGTAGGGRQDDYGEQAKAFLEGFLQENAVQLQAIICSYVAKMGLATGADVEMAAAEVFQDAVLEMLAHADRFNLQMQPRAWFLAIATNILKRYRTSIAKRYRFEVLVGSLASRSDLENEQDVLDMIMACSTPGPEQIVEANEGVSVQFIITLKPWRLAI
jgi:DNA-directed RNA polymerase specialized sigma24 family protein